MEDSKAGKAIEFYLASLICMSGTPLDSLQASVAELRARSTRELLTRMQLAARIAASSASDDDQVLSQLSGTLARSTVSNAELARALLEEPARKRQKLEDASHPDSMQSTQSVEVNLHESLDAASLLGLTTHSASRKVSTSRKPDAAKVIYRVVTSYWQSYKLYESLRELNDDSLLIPKFMHKRYYPPKYRQLWMGTAVWKIHHTQNRRKEIAELATNTWHDKKLSLRERFNKVVDLLTLQEIWDIGW